MRQTQSAGRFTQTPAKHEAECFAQPNCDVIQKGAEKVNRGWNEKTRVSFRLRAQGTYAITGNPED